MRHFSWCIFTMTGDIEAYLLYKQANESIEMDESMTLLTKMEQPPVE